VLCNNNFTLKHHICISKHWTCTKGLSLKLHLLFVFIMLIDEFQRTNDFMFVCNFLYGVILFCIHSILYVCKCVCMVFFFEVTLFYMFVGVSFFLE